MKALVILTFAFGLVMQTYASQSSTVKEPCPHLSGIKLHDSSTVAVAQTKTKTKTARPSQESTVR